MTHNYHPLADVFPLMEGEEFRELVEDVREHGLREAIVLHQGAVLDGRNRHRACLEARVEPRFVDYDGDDPIAYVVSLNLRRRHLDESQRSMCAGRLANLQWGGNRRSDQDANLRLENITQAEAARRLNVGLRTVQNARVVLTRGTPELQQAVDRGEVSVSAAATQIRRRERPQNGGNAEASSRRTSNRRREPAPQRPQVNPQDQTHLQMLGGVFTYVARASERWPDPAQVPADNRLREYVDQYGGLVEDWLVRFINHMRGEDHGPR